MENGVLQIGYHAQEDDLTNRVYNNFVRTNPPRAQEGYVMPMLTNKKFGWARIAFVKAYTTFGFHSSFKYDIYFTDRINVPQTKIERTDHIIYPIQTDYTDVIQEIKNTKFTILALYADAGHAASFLAAAYRAGLINSGMQLVVASDVTTQACFTSLLSKGLTTTDISEILRGAISFRPILNRTQSNVSRSFIERFRNQPHTLGNGTHCDQLQDIDGNYVNQKADGSVCAGLNFSAFDVSGSDITADAFYAYDAVLTLAKSLHRYIHVEHLESLIGTPYHYYYLMQSMNYVDFEGASGHVAFEPFPDRQNNDRLVDILYEVVNFNPAAYDIVSGTDPSMGFVRVGYVNTDTGFYPCEQDNEANCYEFVFRNNGDEPPPDRPVVELLHMAKPLKGLLCAFAALTLVVSVGLAVSLLIFRERRLIRILQPEFGAFVFIGCIILAVNAILSARNVTDSLCRASFCLGHIGFCLIVSPLVAKTTRINIVLNGKLRKVKITLWQTFLLAIALLLPMIICIVIFASGHENFSTGQKTITNSLETHTKEAHCKQESSVIVYFMYAYEGCLMVVALLLCYPIRNLPAGISDVKDIANGVFHILIATSHCANFLGLFFASSFCDNCLLHRHFADHSQSL
jgi:hypothetical protein